LPLLVLALSSPCALPYQISSIFAIPVNFYQIEPIGNFEKRNFPQFRNPTIDTMIWGRQRHHVPILLEIDVTAAQAAIYYHRL
jgi:hypothetical protein